MAPATYGVHSAILQILDPDRSLMIHQTAVTIVAAEEFTASADYTISHTGQAPRPGSVSHFIRVPEQAPVLAGALLGDPQLRDVLDGASRADHVTRRVELGLATDLEDPLTGRDLAHAHPISTPPYYAIQFFVQPGFDFRVLRQQIPRPGHRDGSCFVARAKQRHGFVATAAREKSLPEVITVLAY